jgi:serine/threonine protein kinase
VQREWTRARAWVLKGIGARSASPEHSDGAINHVWVDSVFDEALALPAAARPGFLERCSAAPGGLRVRVEELLRLAAEPAPGLDPAISDRTFSGPSSRMATFPFPPSSRWSESWRLARRPCHGARPKRDLILVEPADLRVRRRGFSRWCARLGTLRYPATVAWRASGARFSTSNIARFLDGGQADDGRIFFVTEYIEGRPLDRFCDEELLTIEERLDLFLAVCTAVQHAHRRLVVHGDITAANVLVTPDRDVKLIDLGVARLLARRRPRKKTRHAADGSDAGLRQPEQVRGEPVAVASDVYQQVAALRAPDR